MDELGSSGGGEISDPAVSGAEQGRGSGLEDTSGTERDTGRSSIGGSGDSRQSGRDPGPAETLTRTQYAGQMRDGPAVEYHGAPEHDGDGELESEVASADRSAADRELAEPRSRREVADEAREASDTLESSTEQRSDRHDGPDHRFSVAQAERTVGDTTPTGIGLKLAGEEPGPGSGHANIAGEAVNREAGPSGRGARHEHDMIYVDGREVEATHNPADGVWFPGMGEIPDAPFGDPYGTGRAGEVVGNPDDVKLSRLERFNHVVCERLGDIVEQIDHNAEIVHDLHLKDPPPLASPTFKGTADRSPQTSPVTIDHGVDFGHGLDAALVMGAVGVKVGNWVHEKWQQRAKDRHHGSN
jgi:hypothetical protein